MARRGIQPSGKSLHEANIQRGAAVRFGVVSAAKVVSGDLAAAGPWVAMNLAGPHGPTE